MIQTEGANVHIFAKEAYPDQQELISMMKATYKDYWETKNDGQPRESQSRGNFWRVDHRVLLMDKGPLMEKEIYFIKKDGTELRIPDSTTDPETSLEGGLERQRQVIEKIAFLTTGYEAHERSEGDIARIDEATGDLDIFNYSRAGTWTRDNLSRELAGQVDTPSDYEVVNWKFISTDIETWKSSKEELLAARKTNRELPLPPTDSGYPQTEKDYYASVNEGFVPSTNKVIKFG